MLESERNFLASLREQRAAATVRRPRDRSRLRARWAIVALGVAVFLACIIFDGISRHH